MDNFSYCNPTKILFGQGQIANIPNEIPQNARILMTYGHGSIKRNGVYDEVMSALQGCYVVEFGGIDPNPVYEYLLKAVELIKKDKLDFILAVGGGSVIDASKLLSVAPFLDDPWKELSQGIHKGKLPLGTILTLPATGSEMNGGYVVTYEAFQDKRAFVSPPVYPQFSVLDPRVVGSLPKTQLANGVVDAFVHVIEQYLTYPVNAVIQDGFAESILRALIEVGPKVVNNPKDYDLAANFMWCTTMALNGLIGAGVPHDWATHMIGHELTALYGLDHARTLAIILPALMRVQKVQKREKLYQYAQNVWNLSGHDQEAVIEEAIEKTESFFRSLDVKTRWQEYGIHDAHQKIPAKLHNSRMLPLGERADIDQSQVEKILLLAQL